MSFWNLSETAWLVFTQLPLVNVSAVFVSVSKSWNKSGTIANMTYEKNHQLKMVLIVLLLNVKLQN